MESVAGKTVFITGGASGIGFGMAQALAEAGANVVIADIDAEAAAAAAGQLRSAVGLKLDVTRSTDWQHAVDVAIAEFGKIHILCNNAGVSGSMRTPLPEISEEAWAWTRSVNLDGVQNGIRALLPHIVRHGEEGHVVNTGSMASLIGMAGTGDYTAAKFGVAGLTEVLRNELKDTQVGVSILCPGHTRTNLVTSSQRTMPAADARKLAARVDIEATAKTMLGGLDPRITGSLVLRAILENRCYIFSHPEYGDAVRARFDAILDDVAWASACRNGQG